MKKLIVSLFLILLGISLSSSISYAQLLGGEITWQCQGNGEYVFELKTYRDCNDIGVNNTQVNLSVWGHPTITTVPVTFVNKTDISPTCTAASGNNPLDCGTGPNGGNGIGAIEENIYRSSPVVMTGSIPATGWHITYQSSPRNSGITNLQNPAANGMTFSASMFPSLENSNSCADNSPTFNQKPHFISCTGTDYTYNIGATDNDLDSLVYSFGDLYNDFNSGAFNPPTNPALSPFVGGYSTNSPTPSSTMNGGNANISLHPQSGQLHFKSVTSGVFAYKTRVDSYRKGVKIATVEREAVFIVSNCSGTNNAPNITAPFAGGTSYETTIFAGDLVTFNLATSDNDLLQDGTPQTVSIFTTGSMYGANNTDANSGCGTLPCATSGTGPDISGIGNATMNFSWKTDCSHLINSSGIAQNELAYYFVFKVQDNYCPVPQVKYVTVTIKVKNREVLPAPSLKCVTTEDNGDITLEWNTITDPFGTFQGYEINGVNGGTYGATADINTTTFTIPGGVGMAEKFYISTLSGCNGISKSNSDTLANIHLDLNNPGNGEAVLDWNKPSDSPIGAAYDIYKEFPAGIWSLIANVPYNTTKYRDTITVCEEFINYRIVLVTPDCEFKSNIAGDVFKDKIVPDIPVISYVDIDTITSNITINWNENSQQDTYGYVIYQTDGNGNLVPIDTLYGIQNTSYTHYEDPENGPYQYSIAAFDSCYTVNIPPTYQTSAKANPHTTILLKTNLNVCERKMYLNWSDYIGFNDIQYYQIFTKTNNGPWTNIAQTNNLSHSLTVNTGDEVIAVVQAVSDLGTTSFSNIDTLSFAGSTQPAMSFLNVVTIEQDHIKIVHQTSLGDGVEKVILEKYNPRLQAFEEIDYTWVDTESEISFIDKDVDIYRKSYTYRTQAIDTCDQPLGYSNIGRSILLSVTTNEVNEYHVLQWTPYEKFIGNLYGYEVYRAVNEQFQSTPIAYLPPTVRSYTDTVTQFGDSDDGKICYYVKAIEGGNLHGLEETSFSNKACGIISPNIFVPNAFTVGGKNPIFKPETRQRKIDEYLFEIYDRYGKIIFSTTSPDEGWNGYLPKQTKVAREGVYVYRLALRDGNGIEVVKHGHVTLLNYSKVGE